MIDVHARQRVGLVDARDLAALLVIARVALAREHDAHGPLGAPGKLDLTQALLGSRDHDIDQVGLETRQDDLRLRVAKACVELEQFGAFRRKHETAIEDASIVDVLLAQTGDGTLHDVDHGRMLLISDDGHRRIHAHAARIGALVVLVGTLVILRGSHGKHGDAIGKGEHGALGAGHHLLDDDRGARLAKATVKALANGFAGLLLGERNRNALARRQAVGLDDDGSAMLVEIGQRGIAIREGAICRRGQVVLHHEALGEVLGAFETRTRGTGAKAIDASPTHGIGDTGDKRSLRADDHELATIGAGKIDDGLTVLDVEVNVSAELCRSTVTRCDEELVALGRLGKRRGDGALAPAASQKQDIHVTSILS